jgi:hypothetical protein
MTILDDATRVRLKQELQRDKSKPFDSEFIRTTNLERAVLDEYGDNGASFLLEHLGFDTAFDASCPWQVKGMDAINVVRRVLAPLYPLLPTFIDTLEDRVRYVAPVRRNGAWALAYIVDRALYDGRQYYQLLLGGAPNATPHLSERAASLGWIIPASLARLCAVHDGFGAADSGILTSASLVDMGQMMDAICEQQNAKPDGYVFQDLLEFLPDGAGNCQAFHRRRSGDLDPPTVDWDHETWEISGEMPFFSFADERLMGQILDEE